MVLKRHIKAFVGLSLFLTVVVVFSCEELTPYFVDCSECSESEPVRAKLEIKCSKVGGEILLNIYEGNIEDSILYDSFLFTTATGSTQTSRHVPINKTFTLTARYFYQSNYYVAVNSVTPRVKYVKDQCEEPCYFIFDDVVDLRLKYTK